MRHSVYYDATQFEYGKADNSMETLAVTKRLIGPKWLTSTRSHFDN